MIINGINRDKISVSHGGLPHGSVLGSILFVAYINDLHKQVKFRIRHFADHTATYVYCNYLNYRRPGPTKKPSMPRAFGKDVGYAIESFLMTGPPHYNAGSADMTKYG